jgi:prepilin-type N-terminal cleavage/methylation domain-containing protein
MRGGLTSQKGFTLIEVIITLVLFGIMATMLGPYLARSVSQSSTPLVNLTREVALQASMENIIYNYNLSYTSNLAGLKSYVANNASGKYSIVTNEYAKVNVSNQFVVDASSSTYLLVSIKSLTTSEQLTMVFSNSGS